MRKLIIILLFATLFITACKKEIAETKTATETSLTNAINAPVNCTGNTWGDQQLFKGDDHTLPLVYNNKVYVFRHDVDKLFIFDGTSWDSISLFIPFNVDPDFVLTIGNKGYLGHTPFFTYGSQEEYFWEYDFVAKTWSSKAIFPGPAPPAATFTIGNKGYLVGGARKKGYYTIVSGNDTWEYNQATNSWVQKADLPFFGIENADGFSINNKGYVMNGFYRAEGNNPTAYLTDLYEYNPATNAWSFKTPFPGEKRGGTNVFVIGQAAYAGGGRNRYGFDITDYYKYSPATNAWVSIANFPALKNFFCSFSINSKGYSVYRPGSDVTTPLQMYKYTPKTCTLQGSSQ